MGKVGTETMAKNAFGRGFMRMGNGPPPEEPCRSHEGSHMFIRAAGGIMP